MGNNNKKRKKAAPRPVGEEPTLLTSTGLFFYNNMNRAGDDAIALCENALNICDSAIQVCNKLSSSLGLSSSDDPPVGTPPRKKSRLN